jgi:Peptidase A4 family
MDSIKTYPLPPDSFDPRTAQPRELRRYGVPPRPDAATRPKLASLWDKIFSRKLTYIVPSFQPIEKVLPHIKPRGPLGSKLTTVTHPFWSGCVVHATSGQMFNWVQGEWVVPDVAPPISGQGNWYSFAWIGIDGTADVTQIGTIQYVSTNSSGTVSKDCYAVSEWWPRGWSVINNFPVSFGDTMIGLICLESTTDAYVNLVNLTTGLRAGFDLTPPTGTVSAENQIEWILEHPGVSGESPQLPKFGEIFFDQAMGGQGLDFVADAGTDTVINMVENNVTVATTTVETPTLIKIAYTGNN